ncbi:MAG: virulence-associated protein E [Pseudomonas sp.]|jgi:hypothetical protein|nr:MAG: virulence-associated protein E [Pseudomonas sp.]
MNPVDNLLSRLSKVRQRKPGSWVACCPAHDDKSPSLYVTEADDGRALLKCWGGCTTEEICAAVGLELRDLFLSKSRRRGARGPSPKAILHEATIVRIAEAQLLQGLPLSAEDQARYELARQRLGVA